MAIRKFRASAGCRIWLAIATPSGFPEALHAYLPHAPWNGVLLKALVCLCRARRAWHRSTIRALSGASWEARPGAPPMDMATIAGMVSALAVLPDALEGLLAAPCDHRPVCSPNKSAGRPALHLALGWPVASQCVWRRELQQTACMPGVSADVPSFPSDCTCHS